MCGQSARCSDLSSPAGGQPATEAVLGHAKQRVVALTAAGCQSFCSSEAAAQVQSLHMQRSATALGRSAKRNVRRTLWRL